MCGGRQRVAALAAAELGGRELVPEGGRAVGGTGPPVAVAGVISLQTSPAGTGDGWRSLRGTPAGTGDGGCRWWMFPAGSGGCCGGFYSGDGGQRRARAGRRSWSGPAEVVTQWPNPPRRPDEAPRNPSWISCELETWSLGRGNAPVSQAESPAWTSRSGAGSRSVTQIRAQTPVFYTLGAKK